MNAESKMWPGAEKLPRSMRRTTFPLGETDFGVSEAVRAMWVTRRAEATAILDAAATGRARRHARLEDFVRTGSDPREGALG